jgi:threonylcarbamoyladenosine tRNA methylthiotransferase MtaB
LHIFRFSPREGTAAAEMPDRVPGQVQQQRAGQLAELGEQLRQRYFASLAGRRLQVLAETQVESRPGILLGTSDRYAAVELPGGNELIGWLVQVIAGPVVAGRIQAGIAGNTVPNR